MTTPGAGKSARLAAVARSPGCWVAVAFLAGTVALGRWVEASGGPEAIVTRFGMAAPLVTVPLHAVLAVSPFPSELFVIANGAAYGFWLGSGLGWVGWILGSALEYGLVRRGLEGAERAEGGSEGPDARAERGRLPGWLRKVPVGHPAFLIAGRWVPMGFHIVNVAAGAARVPFGRFLACATVGCLPLAVLFAGIGAGIHLF